MKKKKFKIPGREHWAAVGLARICSKQYVLVDAQFNDIKMRRSINFFEDNSK